MERFAITRATRQSEISEAMGARGLARSSDRYEAFVDAAAELWRETAAGIIADHLAVAGDIRAGIEELDGIQKRVLQSVTDAEYGIVSWISALLAGDDRLLWKQLVDRIRIATWDTRREAEIAFGREKLRRTHSTPLQMTSAVSAPRVRDFFLSHAGEDKASIASPLAEELHRRGHSVWFDEYELTVGDSLRRGIDRGLVDSRFGIVVLSHSFFAKSWPQYELDGLVARSMVEARKVILPVWHHVTRDAIAAHSPKLADLLGVDSVNGVEHVAMELVRALRAVPR